MLKAISGIEGFPAATKMRFAGRMKIIGLGEDQPDRARSILFFIVKSAFALPNSSCIFHQVKEGGTPLP